MAGAFAFILTMNISQAATVFVTLWIYREIGFPLFLVPYPRASGAARRSSEQEGPGEVI